MSLCIQLSQLKLVGDILRVGIGRHLGVPSPRTGIDVVADCQIADVQITLKKALQQGEYHQRASKTEDIVAFQ